MNRKFLIMGVFLAGFLGGALALVALQVFPLGTAVLAQTGGESGERVVVIAVEEVINGETFAGEVRVVYEDAPELPAGPPAQRGLFLGRSSDMFTLGTGPLEVELAIEVLNDEEPVTTVQASHGGDEVTFTVTPDTIVYQDTTERPHITPADIEAGEMTISRTVAPGSLDEIGDTMIIRVWGTEQGGQLVADVLVYEPIR